MVVIRSAVVILGVAAAMPSLGVWTEPSVAPPSGALAVPILGSGDQSKQGSLELSGGATANGVNATVAAQKRNGIFGSGVYFSKVPGVSAGVYGKAATGVVPGAPAPAPIQVGVYGAAGANNSNSVGVYGDNGGNALAWAGYFLGGSTGFEGALSVSGISGNVVATLGINVTGNPASGATLSVTGTANGKAAISSTTILNPAISGSVISSQAVAGVLDSAIPSCATANCSAILGASTDYVSTDLAAGKWDGYFLGNVYITDRLYLNFRRFSRVVAPTGVEFYHPADFQRMPSGALLGYTEITGGTYNGQGGITGDGSYLGISAYNPSAAPINNSQFALARFRPTTFAVEQAGDTVDQVSPNALGHMTYDGQYYWAQAQNKLWKLDGSTLMKVAEYAFSGSVTNLRWPYFDGTYVLVPIINSSAQPALGRVNRAGTISEVSLAATGCTAVGNNLVSGGGYWYVPMNCGNADTRLARVEMSTGNVTNWSFGVHGFTTNVAFDGTNLWVISRGGSNNLDEVLKVSTAGTLISSQTLPATSGFTTISVTTDSTNLWVAPSISTGLGKLFRINLATAAATEIDRSDNSRCSNPGSCGHIIWDVYFDGTAIWLTGYRPTATPRVNIYIEKRKP